MQINRTIGIWFSYYYSIYFFVNYVGHSLLNFNEALHFEETLQKTRLTPLSRKMYWGF